MARATLSILACLAPVMSVVARAAEPSPTMPHGAEPAPAADPVRTPRAASRKWPLLARFGVRAGHLTLGPAAGLQYEDGPFVGLSLELTRGSRPRVSCELGLDVTTLREAEGVEEDSVLLFERADFLFPLGGGDARASPYLLCGAGGMQEFLVSSESGAVSDNYAWPVDVGVGVTFAGGRLDVRAVYSVLLDTENVESVTTIGLGMRF